MTNTKSTKRALLASVMAMLLCFPMLLGTTFPWFTDSVTSAGNKIVAGTLDVELLMDADVDGTYDDISDSTSPIFGESSIAQNNNAATLWEPGKTQVAYLAIKNNGQLALKYTVGLDVQNVSKDLYEVMEYAIVPDADANHKVTSWTSGNSVEVGTQSVSGDVSLPVGATHYFALVIHMDEEAGNEYQGGEVNFDLTVLATQDTVESDSFGNQYDANASEVEVVVDSTEELEAALTAGKKIIGVKGSVELAAAPAGQNRDMDHVTLVGLTDDATITVTGNGGGLDNLNLKDIKVVDSTFYTYENGENAWEFTYLELGGTATYTNVVFDDGVMSDGSRANFVNCTFNGHNNDSSAHGNVTMYGAWVYNGEATFTNCTFVGTRGVKVHEAYGSEVGTVVIDNNTFAGLTQKPGVVIGTVNADTTVAIKDSKFVGCQAGDQGEYIYESDTNVNTIKFTNENNKVLTGVTTVANAAEFLAATNGGKLFLTDDINYNNTDPEKQLILKATDAINFDGNGNTITSAGADPSIDNHGYVAFVPPAGEDATVSDLTVTGEGFVEVGDYSYGKNTGKGDYTINNLVVKDLAATLAVNNKGFVLAPAFCHYGNAVLNDCIMTGTTNMVAGALPIDAAFVNSTTTLVNRGEYGVVYCYENAKVTFDDAKIGTLYAATIAGNVTIKAGTVIDKLVVDYGTSAGNVTKARLEKLVIENGTTINKIVYAGNTYTIDTWNTFVAGFGA